MPDEVRTILVELRFAVAQGDQKAAQDAINKLEGSTKTLGKTVKTAEENFRALRMTARELSQVGLAMTAAGAAILGPLTLAANKYVQMAGMGEVTSKKWLEAQKSLEDSTVRIGRVTAEIMLPTLTQAANIMAEIAGFAERNPDAVRAMVTVGGALAALGVVTVTAAELLKVVADVGLLLQKIGLVGGMTALGTNTVATTVNTAALEANTLAQGGKTVAGVVGAIAGAAGVTGLALGGIITGGLAFMGVMSFGAYKLGMAIDKLLGIKMPEWLGGPSTANYAVGSSAANAPLGYSPPDPKKEADRQKAMMQTFVDDFKAEQEARKKYADTVAKDTRDFQQQQTRELENFQNNEAQIEADNHAKRVTELRNFAEQEAQTQQDNQLKRIKEIRDFVEQEAQAEQDYYRQRTDAAAAYNTDVQRMEQDHQIAMQRSQQDHQRTMLDFAQSNDVLGAYQEISRYNTQRQRDEQDYKIQAQRKSQDFAKQISDMEANFQVEEQRRQDNFAQQISDEDAQNKLDAQRRRDAFDQQMKDEDEQNKLEADRRRTEFTRQRQQEQTDFNQRMSDLAIQFRNEEILRRQAYTQQLIDLNGALAQEKALRDAYNQAMVQSFQQTTGTTTNKSLTINNPNFPASTNPQDTYAQFNRWLQQAFQ